MGVRPSVTVAPAEWHRRWKPKPVSSPAAIPLYLAREGGSAVGMKTQVNANNYPRCLERHKPAVFHGYRCWDGELGMGMRNSILSESPLPPSLA